MDAQSRTTPKSSETSSAPLPAEATDDAVSRTSAETLHATDLSFGHRRWRACAHPVRPDPQCCVLCRTRSDISFRLAVAQDPPSACGREKPPELRHLHDPALRGARIIMLKKFLVGATASVLALCPQPAPAQTLILPGALLLAGYRATCGPVDTVIQPINDIAAAYKAASSSIRASSTCPAPNSSSGTRMNARTRSSVPAKRRRIAGRCNRARSRAGSPAPN